MGFQIVFNKSEIKKILKTDLPNALSPTTWEPGFADIRLLEELQRQPWCLI